MVVEDSKYSVGWRKNAIFGLSKIFNTDFERVYNSPLPCFLDIKYSI
jgi:hypothetical protein